MLGTGGRIWLSAAETIRLPAGTYVCVGNEEIAKCERLYEKNHFKYAADSVLPSFGCVVRFVKMLDELLSKSQDKAIIVDAANGCVFKALMLLGAYKIVTREQSPEELWHSLCGYQPIMEMLSKEGVFDEYHGLLLSCWGALDRATKLRWVEMFDMEEYTHYENPLEGDLHWIVPEKILAFCTPSALAESQVYYDDKESRFFSPTFYVEPFQDMNIKTVIGLVGSDVEDYDASAFRECGLRCTHLDFDEKDFPPLHHIVEFLHVLETTIDGCVAVHCRTGRAQTAIMTAIFLMSKYAFSASEAICWIRLARPGSIRPDHEAFLRNVQRARRQLELKHPDDAHMPRSESPRCSCSSRSRRRSDNIHNNHGSDVTTGSCANGDCNGPGRPAAPPLLPRIVADTGSDRDCKPKEALLDVRRCDLNDHTRPQRRTAQAPPYTHARAQGAAGEAAQGHDGFPCTAQRSASAAAGFDHESSDDDDDEPAAAAAAERRSIRGRGHGHGRGGAFGRCLSAPGKARPESSYDYAPPPPPADAAGGDCEPGQEALGPREAPGGKRRG